MTIVKAERVRVGGVAGFFAREQFEVTVEVPDTAVAATPAPPTARAAAGPAARTAAPRGPAAAPAAPPAAPAPTGIEALLAAAEREDADRAPRGAGAPGADRHAEFDAIFGRAAALATTATTTPVTTAPPAALPARAARPAVVDLTDDADDPWVDAPVPAPSRQPAPPSDLAERLAAAWAAQAAQAAQAEQALEPHHEPAAPAAPAAHAYDDDGYDHAFELPLAAPSAPASSASWAPDLDDAFEPLDAAPELQLPLPQPVAWSAPPSPSPEAAAADVDDLLAGLAHGLLADGGAPQPYQPQHLPPPRAALGEPALGDPATHDPALAGLADPSLLAPPPAPLPARRAGRSFAPLPDARGSAQGYALQRSAVLGAPEAPHAPDQPVGHFADHRLPDRLAALGVPVAWLWELPLERSAALRELSVRLASAAAARPSRRAHLAVAAEPVVVVLADLEDALPVADQLATGMGLDADDVVVMGRRLRGTGSQRCLPSRQELHDAVAGARAARRSLVVVLPAPVGAAPPVRAAVADTLDQLAPDEVWAVVDATRRLDDSAAWLTAVGGDRGVDALAVVNTEVTSAPAAALALQAPVVLVGDRHATPEAWVSLLAARLAEQDLR
ncbi:hypothetical protein [Quadrisphaera sp. INWT6]|uniref:hypothetical protein n=1 Tax=Quadrisphaera sp. INWT6 TaxID=2596917 RepID=UPI0018921033|nr:hypothetical protein [Quadrisphaera sp. INWT6]MBF5083107.1 hypothetical protein [Quadrisphaera sp. INWT6]